MKKTASIICAFSMLFAILVSCCGCHSGNPTTESTTGSTAENTMGSAAESTTDDSSQTKPSPSEVVVPEFYENYTYQYEGRDRQWEEDVIFLARAFLGDYPMKGHPLFMDKEVGVWMPDLEVESLSFYNADMRTAFMVDLEFLIREIPVLSDTEIVYEMMRIVAKLSDLHSYVSAPSSDYFVFMVEPFYSDEGMQLRMVRLPIAYEAALYGELVAINDVPIDDVVERLGQFISHEWEYGKMNSLTSMLSTCLINKKGALQAAGIVDAEDTSAKFEIITEQGEHIFAEIPALPSAEYKAAEKSKGDWFSLGLMSYNDYWTENYFLRYEEENNLLYIRFNREQEMTNYRFSEFLADIKTQAQNDNCEKIVVDLRLNGGGNGLQIHEDLVQILSQSPAENIYILLDPASYSDGVLLSLDLRQNLSNAVIVGTPGGQGPNFFATATFYTLPNSGLYFAVSSRYFLWDPEYPHEALMPDITVYQTLEDYKSGRDTVLEYVRNK